MTRLLGKFMVLLVITLVITGNGKSEDLTNPYEILNRHFEAMGGLDVLRAETSRYSESKIEILGTGLEGTVKVWSKHPIRERNEADLGILKQTGGDNGVYRWLVDNNGKLSIQRDEATMKRRELRMHLANYEYVDPESEVFTVTLEGIAKVNGTDCYVVRIANSINSDVRKDYYDVSSFLVLRQVNVYPDREEHIDFSDFRDVGGMMVAFKQQTKTLPENYLQLIEVTKYQSNVEIHEAMFQPPLVDVKDYQFTLGDFAENVAFQFIEDHIYLPVTVKGSEKLWILDSGAGMSVIDIEYALEMGLKVEGNIKGRGAGSTVDVSFAEVPGYSIKGIRFESQKIAAIDFRAMINKVVGVEVVGILGYDFLSRFVTCVDYSNNLLAFYDPDKFEYDGDGKVLDAPLTENFFTPEIKVDGKYKGLWNLDLGAGGPSFHYPYSEEQGFLELNGVDAITFGAGGTHRHRKVEFEKIEFAGFEVEKPIITIPQKKGDGAFSGSHLIGNLGNDVLKRFVIYLDYKRQQLIVEKGRSFTQHFPRDKSGLQVIRVDDGYFEVIFAAAGTPAEEAGFLPGDMITAIDGVNVGDLEGIVRFRKMLREQTGTEYRISILRQQESMDLNLKLRDLF